MSIDKFGRSSSSTSNKHRLFEPSVSNLNYFDVKNKRIVNVAYAEQLTDAVNQANVIELIKNLSIKKYQQSPSSDEQIYDCEMNRIIRVAKPKEINDVVNKSYVDENINLLKENLQSDIRQTIEQYYNNNNIQQIIDTILSPHIDLFTKTLVSNKKYMDDTLDVFKRDILNIINKNIEEFLVNHESERNSERNSQTSKEKLPQEKGNK